MGRSGSARSTAPCGGGLLPAGRRARLLRIASHRIASHRIASHRAADRSVGRRTEAKPAAQCRVRPSMRIAGRPGAPRRSECTGNVRCRSAGGRAHRGAPGHRGSCRGRNPALTHEHTGARARAHTRAARCNRCPSGRVLRFCWNSPPHRSPRSTHSRHRSRRTRPRGTGGSPPRTLPARSGGA